MNTRGPGCLREVFWFLPGTSWRSISGSRAGPVFVFSIWGVLTGVQQCLVMVLLHVSPGTDAAARSVTSSLAICVSPLAMSVLKFLPLFSRSLDFMLLMFRGSLYVLDIRLLSDFSAADIFS